MGVLCFLLRVEFVFRGTVSLLGCCPLLWFFGMLLLRKRRRACGYRRPDPASMCRVSRTSVLGVRRALLSAQTGALFADLWPLDALVLRYLNEDRTDVYCRHR